MDSNLDLRESNVGEKKLPIISKNCGLIDNTYLCFKNYVIGSGSFGKVLYGIHVDRQSEYAIKFEKSTVKNSVLAEELRIYTSLKGGDGIPQIYYYGKYKEYKVMVMDLLGPSLDKFFKICNKRLSLETTVNFGEQMISRVEFVHSKSYLHRDIKPNNFNLGSFSRNFNDSTIFIVDFGLSKEYVEPDTGLHYDYKDGRSFVGTPRYASVNTHLGIRQSRRDDLESIIYVLIYFLKGELPWQGIRAKTKSEKKEKIKMKKKTMLSEELCSGLPPEMAFILNYTKNLKFDQTPDYEYMRNLLNKIKSNFNYPLNVSQIKWEWNVVFIQARLSKKNFMVLKKQYEKLYDGYPLINFEEYLKTLDNEGQICHSSIVQINTTTMQNLPTPNLPRAGNNMIFDIEKNYNNNNNIPVNLTGLNNLNGLNGINNLSNLNIPGDSKLNLNGINITTEGNANININIRNDIFLVTHDNRKSPFTPKNTINTFYNGPEKKKK